MPTPRIVRTLALLILVVGGTTAGWPRRAAAQEERCFAETGACLRGRFLAYWEASGGLARNGYPLGEERRELLEDGQLYTVQYLERVRLELHPEHAAPHDVLLGQFGRRALRESFGLDAAGYRAAIAPAPPADGQTFSAETGHNVPPAFLAYWQANGGLARFGYPLTEPFEQELTTGQIYTVQYYERARLEAHPENAAPYDILLGQFGRAILAESDRLAGPFGALYTADERARGLLGTPIAPAFESPAGATLPFEHGRMISWREPSGIGLIAILCGDDPGAGRVIAAPRFGLAFVDSWGADQPPGGGSGPGDGRYEPGKGFGVLWRDVPGVRGCLGYATAPGETARAIAVQRFARGLLLGAPDGRSADLLYAETIPGTGFTGRYERIALPPAPPVAATSPIHAVSTQRTGHATRR